MFNISIKTRENVIYIFKTHKFKLFFILCVWLLKGLEIVKNFSIIDFILARKKVNKLVERKFKNDNIHKSEAYEMRRPDKFWQI